MVADHRCAARPVSNTISDVAATAAVIRPSRQFVSAMVLAATLWPQALVRAQELSTAIGHYHLDVWRKQEAVRLTFASNLVQTSDGYLWLSSQSGLTRFDGVRFTVFDGSNAPALRGLPSLETYPLIGAPNATLWIGSDRGLFTLSGGVARPAVLDSAFATDQPNAAALDSSGAVWVVTRSGRVLHIDRDGAMRKIAGTMQNYTGIGLTVDAAGDVWVSAGERAAYRVHHDSLSRFEFPPSLRLDAVNRVYAAADSSVWFGTETAIVRWHHGEFRSVPLPPRRALGAVSCFAIAPDGALWVGTLGAGLYRYDGERFTSFTTRDGLSDDRIVDILIDRSHNIWVATRDGLNRLRPEPFRVINRQNGVPADLPGAMVEGDSGNVFVGPPTGGVFRGRIDAEGAHFGVVEPVSHADRVNAMSRAWDGTIYTGWLGGSVRRLRVGASEGTLVVAGLPPVTDVLDDSSGSLWIGSWNGLFRLRNGARTELTTRDGLVDNAVQRIFRDSMGTIWVATQTGIARLSQGGERFTAQPTPPGAASRALTVFERPAGSLWIGSAQGLARITGGRPVLLTTAQGLPEDWVGAVEPDDAGHLWLAQLGGLTRVDAADLDAVADGAKASLTSVATFEALDGMPGGDPSGWGHPWSFRKHDGTLWFAVGHGIVVVDPRFVEQRAIPPVIHLEQVALDGAVVPLARTLTLAPSVRRLEIRYTGVDLSNGPAVRFRYRLDGFDTTWTDAGMQRVASYTRLASGRYHFRVAARGGDGSWSADVATIEVVVEPPLYRRLWFIALVAALILLALWAAHRASLRARSDAIRDERSRLAREIHDSLLQGFGGIALQLHAASARLALPSAQQSMLDRILLLADRTLTQAREVVWDIRLPGLSTVELQADCSDAALRILGDGATVTRVEVHGLRRMLDRTTQAEALRIVEEALTNVRKHAGAAQVVIVLDYGWRRLRISIGDNGRGFDPVGTGSLAGHWGLLGMRERASRIGGRLSLTSKPGVGTTVSVDVRYPNARAIERPPMAKD
jgi:signal transduction histidine kinase/ligand-binding sensor domain-containing protein